MSGKEKIIHPQGAVRLACLPPQLGPTREVVRAVFKVDTHLGTVCGESQIPIYIQATGRGSVSWQAWILFQPEETVM